MPQGAFRRNLQYVAAAAPRPAEQAPVQVGQVRCPCGKPVRFRAQGKLASTLYSHRNGGIPCRFGTPSSAERNEVVIMDLEGLRA